ncbi:MAG: spermidine synthase [Pseudomonadota bacterium]
MFFLSGAAGLIFETVWFRLAGLMFGNSVWASSIVLSAFMGGIALGNAIVVKYEARVKRPVRLYGLIEIIVGISGFGLVLLFPALTQWSAPLFGAVSHRPSALNSLRLGISFCLLMVPSTAMGMTLPLLVRALYSESPQFGTVLGRLYGWNTFGAVCGTLLTEVLLVGVFGVTGTGFIAAILCFAAASGAFSIAAGMKRGSADGKKPSNARLKLSQLSPKTVRMLSAGFLCGAVMLALEVVWFRFLLLFIDAVSIAFAMMLAVVLAGIALGGITASAWCRRKPSAHNHLPSAALVAGISCLSAYVAFDHVVDAAPGFVSPWVRTLYFSFPLMFAGSLLSGILFTLIGTTVHEEMGKSLEATGLTAMCNTAGAMFGALAAGLILLPYAGMESALFLLSCSYAVVALITLDRSGGSAVKWRKPAGYALAAAFLVCIYSFPFGTMKERILAVGEKYHRDEPGWKPVAVREGLTETSQFWRKGPGEPPVCTRLITNSHSMAANCLSGRRYMSLFAYWPLAVHPSPRSALLVCYGVGATAKALTESPDLETIDVVDISADIVGSSEIVFSGGLRDPLKDPRVTVHVEDGRFFLQVSKRGFDIITAEPPPPLSAGVVNLYSQEYFELIRNRLNKGGIVTYWLPVYQLPWTAIKSVIKSFRKVFPDCSIWTGAGFEWMMVGTRNAGSPASEEQFARQWRDPALGRELFYCGFEIPELLGTTFLMDGKDLEDWVEDAEPLVDNFPQRILGKPEDHWGRSFHDLEDVMDVSAALVGFGQSEFVRKLWPHRLRERTIEYFHVQRLINDKFTGAVKMSISEEISQVHEILTHTQLRFPVLLLAGGPAFVDSDRVLGKEGAYKGLSRSDAAFHMAVRAVADREYGTAARYLAEVKTAPESRHVIQYRVYLLCKIGQYDEAKKLVRDHEGLFRIKANGVYLSWLSETFGLSESFWQ